MIYQTKWNHWTSTSCIIFMYLTKWLILFVKKSTKLWTLTLKWLSNNNECSMGANTCTPKSIMKTSCLFVCLFCLFFTLKSPKPQCFLPHSWYHWKIVNEKGCTNWFHNVLTCNFWSKKVIEYWTIFY
jgi:hypothetical protein